MKVFEIDVGKIHQVDVSNSGYVQSLTRRVVYNLHGSDWDILPNQFLYPQINEFSFNYDLVPLGDVTVTRFKHSVAVIIDRMDVTAGVVNMTSGTLVNGSIGSGNFVMPFTPFGSLLIASLKRRAAQAFTSALLIDVKVVLFKGTLKFTTYPSSMYYFQ